MRSQEAKTALAVILLCAFSSAPTFGANQSTGAAQPGEIGVRIDTGDSATLAAVAPSATRVIDYGTFQWAIMPRTAYDQAVAAGTRFSYEPEDYVLTLGEQSCDPKAQSPQLPETLVSATTGAATARLVQLVGPTKAEWIDALNDAGITIVQYIHPFTYVVWSDASSISRLGNPDWVRWSGAFEPAYALLPRYRNLTGKSIETRLLLINAAGRDAIDVAIAAVGGKPSGTAQLSKSFTSLRLTLDGDRFADVARIPGVYSVKTVPTDGGIRGEMSALVNINSVDGTNRATGDYPTWLNGVALDGAGVVIANVDGGCQKNHVELVSRILPCSGTSCTGDTVAYNHGTHTAGIMAADGSSGVTDSSGFLRGLGVAPGANLVIQYYSPYYFNAGGMLQLMRDSYSNGASLSGNSWGPAGSPLGYDDDTMQVDIGVRDTNGVLAGDQPLSYVLSIMNGYGSNFQGGGTQGTPDEAKNLIDVGSTVMQNSNGTQNLNIDNVSSNSAHGPCLDGRKLPQIVAPGCSVDSTVPTNSHAVSGYCGTSMASPQVSGGVALFIEYYRLLPSYTVDPSPALVKAAILAQARSLEGHLDADGNVMGPPYDSRQGYGRFDLTGVVDPQDPVLYFDQQVVFSNSGEQWTVDVEPADPSHPMRIMLAWTDAPGHGLGGSTPAWNNNLDLFVDVNGTLYRGNNIASGGFSFAGGVADPKNNTEAVFLGPTSPSAATIRVSASNISSDGLPNTSGSTDQDFALVCYNCSLPPVNSVCASARGDLDGNGSVDGVDMNEFVNCYTGGNPFATGCGCADMNQSNTFEQADIDAFVDCLIGAGCP